jgi:pimeloyl-ACP methyl ester carboxylesterase
VSTSLPNIGNVTTSQADGLEIRFTRRGQSDGVPILLTSPWPESIYAYRAIWPVIEALGPLIAIDLPGFGRSEGRTDLIKHKIRRRFVGFLRYQPKSIF